MKDVKFPSYTRGELAKKLNINPETIRYYENIGLIPCPQRDKNSYRKYSEKYLSILNFIILAKNSGFTLKEINNFLSSKNLRDKLETNNIKTLIKEKITIISNKIEDLNKLKNELEYFLECDEMESCQSIKSLLLDI